MAGIQSHDPEQFLFAERMALVPTDVDLQGPVRLDHRRQSGQIVRRAGRGVGCHTEYEGSHIPDHADFCRAQEADSMDRLHPEVTESPHATRQAALQLTDNSGSASRHQ